MSALEEKTTLLPSLARRAIESELGLGELERPAVGWLEEIAATFVTLEQQHELRGCIGSIEATRPLYEDVVTNALSAAFRDPRFPPVTPDEVSGITIEVSVLSPLSAMSVASEMELLDRLVPFHHGLVLQLGYRRATFLPSVWDQLPSPAQFVRQLKLKAGIPASHWSDDIEILTYVVDRYQESDG